ncbi:MAG: NepR family anti-sigma factor [Pseudomonadota bacterium]
MPDRQRAFFHAAQKREDRAKRSALGERLRQSYDAIPNEQAGEEFMDLLRRADSAAHHADAKD